MTRKRWTQCTLALLFAGLLALVAVVVIVDPFEIYHRALFYNPPYKSSAQMYAIAGVAKSYTYDSIIIGSSVTENCTPSVYDKALGGRFVKLSMNAGLARDHAKIMEIAFRTHDVRHVVYGLDLFAYSQYYTNQKAVTPDYLYDANPFNDVKYWFNQDVWLSEIPAALRRIGTPDEDASRDSMYYWQPPVMPSAEELHAMAALPPSMPAQADIARGVEFAQLNLEYNLLPYIRAHRDTTFTIFLPPYSSLYWAERAKAGSLDSFLAQKQLLCSALLAEPNVRLYDFQLEAQWMQDLSLYYDLIHYIPVVNDGIASAIAEDRCRVTDPEQVRTSCEALRAFAASFFSCP
ncbi:MAG: hypothetical protein IKK34_02725 [Clostridia bacterium]|nr:hypothetical protein [Clostridia bacterium]